MQGGEVVTDTDCYAPEQEQSMAGSRFAYLSFCTDKLPLLSEHFTTSPSPHRLPLCYIYSVTHLLLPLLEETTSPEQKRQSKVFT